MTFLDSQAVFTRIINLIIHLKSNSLKQIPYIGTEILYVHCFATKMLFSFCKSIIPEDFKSAAPQLSFPGVKTRFKAFLQNIPKKRPLRVDLMTPFTALVGTDFCFFGTSFGFAIWNLKLFTSQNRLSMVPKPQNN